ncbi:glycosyltransferase family 2 protein [Rhizobium sp. RAF56]|uniref:glycosyltransferase family 2 protein n=1 Tax=Rhizobium sp. RAF56 TaxID=3233062 RepID=UPI003F9BCFF1
MTSRPTRIDQIDVCLVATRRPELLEKTLRSFHDNLFKAFEIRRIIANIDPLFGSASDQDECVALIRSYDPDALIRLPDAPNFAMAVASNWSASSADFIFHLEDDWLLNRPIHPDQLQSFVECPSVGQISFNHANKRWDRRKRGPFCYAREKMRFLNRKLPFGPKRPTFLTGPSFFRGSFARRSAELIDPAFDPEKQFCRGLNRPLERYVADYRNLIVGEIDAYYIEDIGRQWRSERGIKKELIAGQSYWTDPAPQLDEERSAVFL